MPFSNKKELGLFGEMTTSRSQGRNTKDELEHLVEMQKVRKCPSTDGSIKKMWWIQTHTQGGMLLCHKKEWNLVICDNMDGPRRYHILSEISQKEKDKYFMISLVCGLLKTKQMSLTKQNQSHKYREQTGGCQRRGWWRGDKRNRCGRLRGTHF